MDKEDKATPSAVSNQSPVPTTDVGAQDIGESHSDITRGPPLSITGLEGVIKDEYTPKSTIKASSGCLSNPKEPPTLEGSILVPEENTRTEIRSGARVTEYDLSNLGLTRPVDRIDVSLSYDKPPTHEEVSSMVPEHTRDLCHHLRRVKINIHQGEVPTEGSMEPDSVVSQA